MLKELLRFLNSKNIINIYIYYLNIYITYKNLFLA